MTDVPDPIPVGTAATAGLFVILHSFASGSSALTGTEAISNGVSAFRRPQGRNASQTLAMLGVIAVLMIMGIAVLTVQTHARPSNTVSVVSEIAKAVFGGGFMFWLIQISTFAILILAANTSFQGFPRLAALLARDRFIPRQFENLGDRLVYSNGMVVLSGFAILLIWLFHADVIRLLQLYVVGVFTAFTLSQTGMVRHWYKVSKEGGPKAAGWRWRLAINAAGAVATGDRPGHRRHHEVRGGRLDRHHRHPGADRRVLHRATATTRALPATCGAGRSPVDDTVRNTVVVVVEGLNAATAEAIGYVRSFRGNDFRAVAVSDDPDLAAGWHGFCGTTVPLEVIPQRRQPRDRPGEVRQVHPPGGERLRDAGAPGAAGEARPADDAPEAARVLPAEAPAACRSRSWWWPTSRSSARRTRVHRKGQRPLIPQRTEAIVLVSAVHDGTIQAINYARSLRCTETRALFVALDPAEVEPITRHGRSTTSRWSSTSWRRRSAISGSPYKRKCAA